MDTAAQLVVRLSAAVQAEELSSWQFGCKFTLAVGCWQIWLAKCCQAVVERLLAVCVSEHTSSRAGADRWGLNHILKSSLCLWLSPLEKRWWLPQHDRHDPGFHKSLFKKMNALSEVTWEGGGRGGREWLGSTLCLWKPANWWMVSNRFEIAIN